MSKNRRMPRERSSLFGGGGSSSSGGAGPSGSFNQYDEERENDRAVDEIASRASALKRITIDIQEEAEQQQGECVRLCRPRSEVTRRRPTKKNSVVGRRADLNPRKKGKRQRRDPGLASARSKLTFVSTSPFPPLSALLDNMGNYMDKSKNLVGNVSRYFNKVLKENKHRRYAYYVMGLVVLFLLLYRWMSG